MKKFYLFFMLLFRNSLEQILACIFSYIFI